MNKKLTTLLALGLALTSAGAQAQRINTSETHPTPTEEVTRTTRTTQGSRLRGEGEWAYESRTDILFATRFDTDGTDAELIVYMMSDPDLIEEAVGASYEGSFRIDRDLGECEGVELYDDGLTIYVGVCADGDYVNMVLGSDEDDLIDVLAQMQDGYVADPPRGYELVED